MSTVTTKAALVDLRSLKCACTNGKASGKSHCKHCYFRLPPLMRKALYSGLRHGYEEAYTASLTFLGFESPAMQAESEAAK